MLHPPVATLKECGAGVRILDQTRLPHEECFEQVNDLAAAAHAIATMQVRGAPLIGAMASWGIALAMQQDPDDRNLSSALDTLAATRPTAVNLQAALRQQAQQLQHCPVSGRPQRSREIARTWCADDAASCLAIGQHGADILRTHARDGEVLQVMTHCNAGWLATLGVGTALAPVYWAHAAGLPIHVWVSETRPRNQGLLTAWELARWGVPHTVIADNAAGLLLGSGQVDLVLTGADRIARNGDTANKVGTLLKALAAHAAGVAVYIAAPRSTCDAACPDGQAIPIEYRDGEEVRIVHGHDATGHPASLRQLGQGTATLNPAFDVTPAGLITGIITEGGCIPPHTLASWLTETATST